MKAPLEEPTLSRSEGPVWTNIIVAATGQANVSGNVLVAKNPEVFTYDTDGNLTNDGRWSYTWDAENRLISMQAVSAVPSAAKRKLDFAYDHQGRRVQKVVSSWNGSAYVPQYTNRFVYDGWNLVAILNSDFSLLTSFTWGLDLSGTMEGAGGVGGLLWMTVPSGANAGTYCCAYDANGNVMALVGLTDGTVTARYEYGPFGELLRATGPMAKANPFRFSTKYQDDETGLVYYGYRYYDPSTGRWLSRDPIGNFAGNNLYGFVANNPLTYLDPDGRKTWVPYPYPGHWVDDPQPPPPPPTNAPPIDCSGYSQYKNSSCVTCGGWGSKKKDTYPEKAQKVCEGFAKIYTGASNQSNAACVASCLIKAEAAIQAFPNCSDRNCFRLLAHIACYKDCSFWPDQGLPPGGPSVGALDLLPSATLSPYCQKLVIPPQYWGLW
ncbi:MAG TPA: RHS repeat-associated core domain-containing protein [Candidatus Paceibacterota bacterium]|nr:RHS repeat-associated core domain-containing protein [Candidatus Paceibacterota bacterium]